jgi:hypothetical protein
VCYSFIKISARTLWIMSVRTITTVHDIHTIPSTQAVYPDTLDDELDDEHSSLLLESPLDSGTDLDVDSGDGAIPNQISTKLKHTLASPSITEPTTVAEPIDMYRLGISILATTILVVGSLMWNLWMLLNACPNIEGTISGCNPHQRWVLIMIVHPLTRHIVRWIAIDIIALYTARYSKIDFFTGILPFVAYGIELLFAGSVHIMIATSDTLTELTFLTGGSIPLWIITDYLRSSWHVCTTRRGGTVSWKQYQLLLVHDLYIHIISSILGWFVVVRHLDSVIGNDRLQIILRLAVCMMGNYARSLVVYAVSLIFQFHLPVYQLQCLSWQMGIFIVRMYTGVSIIFSLVGVRE